MDSSTGDPDLDAVVSGNLSSPAAPTAYASTGDPDLDAVVKQKLEPVPNREGATRGGLPGRQAEPGFSAVDFAHQQLTNIASGYRGLGNLYQGDLQHGYHLPAGDSAARLDPAVNAIKDTQFQAPGNDAVNATLGSPLNPQNIPKEIGDYLGDKSADLGAPPWLSTGLKVAPIGVGALLGLRRMAPEAEVGSAGEPALTAPVSDAQAALNKSYSGQSMGAAATAPEIQAMSPGLRGAVETAQEKGATINPTALTNHAEADLHGVQLMEGQATRDPVQFSNEQNSTHPAIAKRINDQEQQLTDAIDNVRREASPTAVQNDPVENGQIAVDSLKAYDEPIKADINAKYDAARKASANGDLQMDGSSFVDSANAALKPQSKFRFLPSNVQGILDDVEKGGGKMSLDDYQAYDTQLGNEIAKARASGDGNAVAAIGKVHSALQDVKPMGAETAQAKGLFDTARSAAKARFDALDADPAYRAAVDDVSLNGVKQGEPSALADKFLDKYALQAPKANVDRLMGKLDPDAQQAVAAHTLSTIRKSAITPNGKVSANGFNGAMEKYAPKLDSLVKPETAESLDSLGRVITNAKVPPSGNFVNYSKSGVIMNAASDAAQHLGGAVLNAKTLGMGLPIVKGMRENAFANRALAPGAGIEQ